VLPPDREGERCFRLVSGGSTMRSAGSNPAGPATASSCGAQGWAAVEVELEGAEI
jgi:hypothetical protein